MSTRPLAVSVTPVFLRLALGVTFLWAGLGKLFAPFDVQGPQAALLANMGVPLKSSASSAPAPKPVATPAPEPAPTVPPPAEPVPTPPTPEQKPAPADGAPDGQNPPQQPGETPGGPGVPPRNPDLDLIAPALVSFQEQPAASPPAPAQTPPAPAGASSAPGARVFTAEDFPTPVKTMRLNSLALLIHAAANPAPDAAGKTPVPLWPAKVSSDRWPVVWAWVATVTETLGGVMILMGMFTRIWALALASVMGVAAWLTQIGPAIQSGTAVLGFLPAYDVWDGAAWTTPLFQLTLLCAAMGLFFSGSGALALDNAMFGSATGASDDDES